MKNYKKIILALSVVLSLMLITAISSRAEDVSAQGGQLAYDFIKAVGAMDENEIPYEAEKKITRAHFVKLALHLANDAPNVLVSDDVVFSDVTPSTKYEVYIETAYRTGYISGSYDGLFHPEDEITLAQSLKILCNILGYQQFAEAKGGFPGGYMVAAQRAGILEGISANDNSGLDMETAMLLLRNCALSDIMQIVSVGENVEMESVSGRTLLTERYEVEYAEGVISANGYTDLFAQKSELDVNQVMIGDMVFDEGKSGAQDYLGYNVILYYDNSGSSVVKDALFVEISDDNVVLSAPGGEYIVADGDSIRCYTDDDSSKRISLSDNATYIRNGKMAVMSPEDLSDVEKGDITFVSNDGDSRYDVVLVTDYDTLIVAGVSAASEVVVSKDGSALYLEKDSDEYTFEIVKDNKDINVSDIAADDVLLVSEGTGSGLYHKKVIVSSKNMNASIDSIGENEAEIAGIVYRLDSSVHSKVEPGVSYRILFDALDNISYIYYENDVVYGYLYKLKKEGFANPECRIFTENNRWVDLEFNDKVKYNGIHTDSEKLYSELTEGGYNMMIRYLVNDERKLIQLETAQEILIGSKDEKLAAENDIFRISSSGSKVYRNGTKSFNGDFFVDNNAKVFVIPSDLNKEKFKIIKPTEFLADTSYSVTAYDVDKYLNCKMLVLNTEFKRNVNSTDKFLVVKNVGQILDYEKNPAPAIRGYWNGMELTFAVKTDDGSVDKEVLNNLREGDVLLFTFDDKSNINSVQVYSSEDIYATSGSVYSVCTVMSGVVNECDYISKHIRLTYSEEGDDVGIAYTNGTTFHIYNTSDKTYSKSSGAEILPGDRLFVNMRYLQCSDVLIIRD